MIRMAKRLSRGEQKRLEKRTEEAKKRGGVSASLFLEGEMNALSDADCFFFFGGRLLPKGLLTVFFPDETCAEITVAEYTPRESMLYLLYRKALAECQRVGVTQVYTVRNPECGFAFDRISGVRFTYEWSEYMLGISMKKLVLPVEPEENNEMGLKAEPAPEGDGTWRYALLRDDVEVAECRILPTENGRCCYLFGLKTKEEWRKKGMAPRLLAAVARQYTENEDAVMRLQVSSKNELAERLYRKLGFVTEEEREYFKTEVCQDGKKRKRYAE